MGDHVYCGIETSNNENDLIKTYINIITSKDTEINEPSLEDVPVQKSDNGDKPENKQTSDDSGDEEEDNEYCTFFVNDDGNLYIFANNQHDTSSDEEGDKTTTKSNVFQHFNIVPSDSDSDEVEDVLSLQRLKERAEDYMKIGKHIVSNFKKSEKLAKKYENALMVDDGKYGCRHCSYSTYKRFALLRHMKVHSDIRPFICSVCSRDFKSLLACQNHMNSHTGTKYKCKFCVRAFTTIGELMQHVRNAHTKEQTYKCDQCKYATVSLEQLKTHKYSHNGERPYQCPHCDYSLTDMSKLKRHILTHTGVKPYECEFCHMCFNQRNTLKVHRLTHTGEKPVFQCELCPTTCRRKTDLRIHIERLHTFKKWIKCRKCGKKFSDRHSLKEHIKTHVKEKCFKCEFCPYATAGIRYLKSHILVHTGEKPHQCGMCEEAFRQKQLLVRHINLYHKSDYVPPSAQKKIYKCDKCNQTFRYQGYLERHNLLKHDPNSSIREENLALKIGRQRKVPSTKVNADDDKPFSCKICKKTFRRNQLLMRHEKLSHDPNNVPPPKQQSYKCDKCKKIFRYRKNFERHNLVKHGPNSSVNTKKLALKLSRQQKVSSINIITDDKLFTCKICKRTFRRNQLLMRHEKLNHKPDNVLPPKQQNYECDKCKKTFRYRKHFERHNLIKHDPNSSINKENVALKLSRQQKVSSININADDKQFTCKVCKRTFRRKQLLTRHENLNHNPDNVPPPKRKSYKCNKCKKVFQYRGFLERHNSIKHKTNSPTPKEKLIVEMGRQRKM